MNQPPKTDVMQLAALNTDIAVKLKGQIEELARSFGVMDSDHKINSSQMKEINADMALMDKLKTNAQHLVAVGHELEEAALLEARVVYEHLIEGRPQPDADGGYQPNEDGDYPDATEPREAPHRQPPEEPLDD